MLYVLNHARSVCRLREGKESIGHSAAILRAAVAELKHTWRCLCSVSCWVGTYSQVTPISLCVDINIVVVTQHSDTHLTQGGKVKVVPWRCICAPNGDPLQAT